MSEERNSFQIMKFGKKFRVRIVHRNKFLCFKWISDAYFHQDFDSADAAREAIAQRIAEMKPRLVTEIFYD